MSSPRFDDHLPVPNRLLFLNAVKPLDVGNKGRFLEDSDVPVIVRPIELMATFIFLIVDDRTGVSSGVLESRLAREADVAAGSVERRKGVLNVDLLR